MGIGLAFAEPGQVVGGDAMRLVGDGLLLGLVVFLGVLGGAVGERRSGLFLLGFAAVVAGVLLVNWPYRRT